MLESIIYANFIGRFANSMIIIEAKIKIDAKTYDKTEGNFWTTGK